ALSVGLRARKLYAEFNHAKFKESLVEVTRLSDIAAAHSNALLKQFSERLEAHREAQDILNQKLNTVYVLALVLYVLTALALAYWFISSIARNAERLSYNSVRLAHGVPLYPPIQGNDEIAQLDRTFRQMADAITEASRKERAVVENARDLICTLDADGVFMTVNPAAREILGRDPDSLIGRVFLDLVAASDRERVNTHLQNLAKGVDVSRLECKMLTKDGSTIDILLTANWAQSDNSFYCVAHNVTHMRQLERMKRQFVAMITHDLRSPLSSVLNTLDAIAAGIYSIYSDKGVTRVNEAKQNIDRMLHLLSDLWEMEKFDAAALTIDFASVDLSEIVEESVGSVRAFAEQQNINISVESEHCLIDADRTRMVQVLVNLLSNAVKFSPAGATVSVRALCRNNLVTAEIIDRGKGISLEDQKIIFEPYKQAAQTKAEKRIEGTGLGLAICKSIMEGHSGSIGVRNTEPSGSTFWIELPRQRQAPPPN
ncbi:MAG TPA: ATP-binding protein, partial [Chroococcales cyanobacterium]